MSNQSCLHPMAEVEIRLESVLVLMCYLGIPGAAQQLPVQLFYPEMNDSRVGDNWLGLINPEMASLRVIRSQTPSALP